MVKKYWNLIDWEPILGIAWESEFSQACSFYRMLMNQKNFHFPQNPGNTNASIFLKSQKTMFLGQFWPLLPDGDFFEKTQFCHTQLYTGPYHHAKFQKKN